MAKRDFPTLLTAFLALAAVGTSTTLAKQASALPVEVCDDTGFCEGPQPFDETFFQVVLKSETNDFLNLPSVTD